MKNDKFKAYLAWVSVCIVWGTTYLGIRIGVKDLPPMLFAGLRWTIAGTFLFLVLKAMKYTLPDYKEVIHAGISGILLLGFGNGLVVFAEQWVPSGLTALILTTVPIWLVIIESFISKSNRVNLITVFGILLGLTGIVIIFSSDIHGFLNRKYFVGTISIMLAVICWSFGTLYSKYKKVNVHPLMNAAVQMLIAGILQTVLGIFLGEVTKVSFHTESLLAFFYLVFFGSLLGYASFIYAISHLPVSFVSTYAYINPIIALFLGWLILSEPINSTIVLSAVLILISVALIKNGSDKKKVKVLIEDN